MRDFLKRPLAIGDTVAMIYPQYKHLVTGTVVAFTPQKIRVSFTEHFDTAPGTKTFLATSDQLIKIVPKKG